MSRSLGFEELVDEGGALSIPEPRRLAALERVECVVVVGASGAGKSTLVRAVKLSPLAAPNGAVEIPPRFVTRPPREGDADGENVFLGAGEFTALVSSGAMAVHWSRELSAGRTERYGFARSSSGKLPLYSANNAWPRAALPHALLVGVYAPEPLRLARLERRSAELWRRAPEELAHRMADPAADVQSWVHLVVHNHGPHEATAGEALIRVVARAVERASAQRRDST